MSWNSEIVEEAWFCSRPFTMEEIDTIKSKFKKTVVDWLADKGCQHYGIMVCTNENHKWLIHNAKNGNRSEYGIYVTDASNMLDDWTYNRINVVRKNVTISQCQIVMGWTAGHTWKDWFETGTCIGAALLLKKYLENADFEYEYYTESKAILKLIKDFLIKKE